MRRKAGRSDILVEEGELLALVARLERSNQADPECVRPERASRRIEPVAVPHRPDGHAELYLGAGAVVLALLLLLLLKQWAF